MGDLAKSRKCLQGEVPKCWKFREKWHFAKKNEKNSGNAPGCFLRFLIVLDRFWWFLSIKTCHFMIFQHFPQILDGFPGDLVTFCSSAGLLDFITNFCRIFNSELNDVFGTTLGVLAMLFTMLFPKNIFDTFWSSFFIFFWYFS